MDNNIFPQRFLKTLPLIATLIILWLVYQNCDGMNSIEINSSQQSSQTPANGSSVPIPPNGPPAPGSTAPIFSENYEIPVGDVSQGNTQYNALIDHGWDFVATNCGAS